MPRPSVENVRLIAERGEKLYAAERRFDLVALLTILTAYAVLFAAMRGLQVPGGTIVFIAVFVTLVGIGQAFLFRGSNPREASSLVGCALWTLMAAFWSLGSRISSTDLRHLPSAAVAGLLAGYVAGVLVGGVFMTAEFLRRWLASPGGPKTHDRPTSEESQSEAQG